MKHEEKDQFKTAQSDDSALTMLEAIAAAKSAVNSMTGQDIDSIVQCSRSAETVWTVALDVIESLARMGDNDLLATYEVQIDAQANLIQFNRLRRYHREDKDA
ncbi:gas vesicle protein [Yoonia sp. F2084L]|uniref:gas vesicle protein GvpO n=1 Tax=Yoonia sp. F2084L TaxID=2926419 RepID=UPI001FF1D7C6|nr:gas vesicle protein GvpO [Yoonia sp. F2084L]MCK0094104.1 gas vesicle protein [Yoonia sp. F2084L]